MIIKVLDVNYEAWPREILGSLIMDADERFAGEPVFTASTVAGKWKIHEFARDAPTGPIDNPANFLVVLSELGHCDQLNPGDELSVN